MCRRFQDGSVEGPFSGVGNDANLPFFCNTKRRILMAREVRFNFAEISVTEAFLAISSSN